MKIKKIRNNGLVIAILVLCLFAFPKRAFSQKNDKLPYFRIGLTDASYYNKTKLRKKIPVLLIYFLPDCEDCRDFSGKLINNIKYLKNIQIVMITNSSLNQLRQFEKDFKVKTYQNIILGTEGWTTEVLREFNIEHFPFAAAYDKNGRLMKIFNSEIYNRQLIRQIINLYQ